MRLLLVETPGALVLADCRVDYDIPGVEPLGPDVSVFLDAPPGWSQGTLEVGPLAVRPVLVIEVTSPDTRRQDFDLKSDFYHRAGIPWYVLVDSRYRRGVRFHVHLVGFRHAAGGFEPAPLDAEGRLWVEPLNAWLRVDGDRVACIDGATGRTIEPFVEQALARQAADARAEAEADARQAADARVATAEAIARAATEARIHAEARAKALDENWERLAEMARAEARGHAEANARASAADAARLAAEARAAALEAEIRRLRGEG